MRRFAARSSALLLGLFAGSASPGDFWELKAGDITVMAEGNRPVAVETATMIVRIRSAARWMASWPAEYRPLPVLAFALDDATIDQWFPRRQPAPNILDGGLGDQGIALHTPIASILIFSINPLRGYEFDQLQHLYGQVLMRAEPTANWPQCVRDGFGVAIYAAELRERGKLYVDADTVQFEVPFDKQPLAPRDFFAPLVDPAIPQAVRARRAFSCHALTMMALHDKPLPRASFAKYFRLVGEGMDIGEATAASFQVDEQQLQKLLETFAHELRWSPKTKKVRAEFPEEMPVWPAPEPMAPERAVAILQQLAARRP